MGKATKKQLWALFCITKKDYRDSDISFEEASRLIEEANRNKKDYVSILEMAEKAGMEAHEAKIPVPMIVQQHSNVLDDNSEVEKQWYVPSGVCGFAWVVIPYKGEGIKFINALKKKGIFKENGKISKSYYGGYHYWVSTMTQSMEKKEAFAREFSRVLQENGIDCYPTSRMD